MFGLLASNVPLKHLSQAPGHHQLLKDNQSQLRAAVKACCHLHPKAAAHRNQALRFHPGSCSRSAPRCAPGAPQCLGKGFLLFAFPFAFFFPFCFSGRGGTCGLGGWSDGAWILMTEGFWCVQPCGPQLPCLQGLHPAGAGAAPGAVCFSHRGLQGQCSLLIPWHEAKPPPCSLPWGLRGAAKLHM